MKPFTCENCGAVDRFTIPRGYCESCGTGTGYGPDPETGGRFAPVQFCGETLSAWIVPRDLWPSNVPEGFVVAEISEDGPRRFVRLA